MLELDRTERLLRPGLRVIELGAAPGGWSQVAAQRIGAKGLVVAVDLLPMAPLDGVAVIQGDIAGEAVRQRIAGALGGAGADLVLSDMAPNMSGVALRDQAAAAELALLNLDACLNYLKPGCATAVKCFQGEDFPAVKEAYERYFSQVRIRKPAASRAQSRECYLVAAHFSSGESTAVAG